MKETFSNDFKKIFLIKFTEELIRQSAKKDITKLEKIIELKEKRKREKLIPAKREPVFREQGELKKSGVTFERVFGKSKPVIRPVTKQIAKPSLFISEPKLPSHLEYLKPIPTAGIEIDLWKLNPLIKDPAVRIIEGNPDEKVKVTGTMGTRQTDIVLSKEDIDRIINKFSEIAKIPMTEGVYRVVAENLILSAIISEVIGSRFVIKKMAYNTKQQYPPPPIARPPITNPVRR